MPLQHSGHLTKLHSDGDGQATLVPDQVAISRIPPLEIHTRALELDVLLLLRKTGEERWSRPFHGFWSWPVPGFASGGALEVAELGFLAANQSQTTQRGPRRGTLRGANRPDQPDTYAPQNFPSIPPKKIPATPNITPGTRFQATRRSPAIHSQSSVRGLAAETHTCSPCAYQWPIALLPKVPRDL